MTRCDLLVDVGRRRFLSGASIAAAGAAATCVYRKPHSIEEEGESRKLIG